MFISEAAALSIVQEMKEITGHDINIMDGTGTIFASTDPGPCGPAPTREPARSCPKSCPA